MLCTAHRAAGRTAKKENSQCAWEWLSRSKDSRCIGILKLRVAAGMWDGHGLWRVKAPYQMLQFTLCVGRNPHFSQFASWIVVQ
eukprot:scaffold110569_cov17-Tisochrysis_lutea.AAC.1